jgi:hypothetical protein
MIEEANLNRTGIKRLGTLKACKKIKGQLKKFQIASA